MVIMPKGRTAKFDKGNLANTDKGQPLFKTEDLIKALFDIESVLEGCMCPFVLLDETARQCRLQTNNITPHLELNEISIGVRKLDLSESARSMLKTMKPDAEWMETNISYMFGSIPVIIWIINKNFEILNHPDKIWFYTTEFRLPNPFDKYWNMRDLVR